jgi:hypothetical protein
VNVTPFSTIVNAIILLPVGAAIDGTRAKLGLLHGERRGYKLVGIVHDWETALIKTRAKEAEVVIIPDPNDFQPDWTPRIEYVGDETQDLARYGHIRHRNDGPDGGGRHRRPRPAR